MRIFVIFLMALMLVSFPLVARDVPIVKTITLDLTVTERVKESLHKLRMEVDILRGRGCENIIVEIIDNKSRRRVEILIIGY